uniref:Ig-like domain-containing protein n=1 Tax=Eptatretus burgeri TaxID=7764 RepID=A0A8C4Q147_EPTBU
MIGTQHLSSTDISRISHILYFCHSQIFKFEVQPKELVAGHSASISCSTNDEPETENLTILCQAVSTQSLINSHIGKHIAQINFTVSFQHDNITCLCCPDMNDTKKCGKKHFVHRIKYSPRNTQIYKGEQEGNRTIICETDSDPPANLTWERVEKPNEDVKSCININRCVLVLDPKWPDELKWYSCLANNGIGEERNSLPHGE